MLYTGEDPGCIQPTSYELQWSWTQKQQANYFNG